VERLSSSDLCFALLLLHSDHGFMGVRFACHACGKRLNIKTELAGRRGVCPSCSVRFRIPTQDQPQSIAVDEESSGTHSPAASDVDDMADELAASEPAAGVETSDSATNHESYSASAVGGSTTIERPKTKPTTAERPATSTDSQPTNPDAILGDSTAVWYVRPPSGGQYGPADGPTMKQWITEGRIADAAMLWRDGWPDWKPAGEILRQLTRGGSARENHSSDEAYIAPKAILATPGNAHLVDGRLVDAPADRDKVAILNRGGPLESSKRKRSRKRIAATVALVLVLVLLVVALAYVILG
jgi:DNA-directed RNA polymerase subunit RPC12/RpoP